MCPVMGGGAEGWQTRWKESLAVPGMCDTGHNVLGKGCGSRSIGKQQEGCSVFSHFSGQYRTNVRCWLFSLSPQEANVWVKTEVESEPRCYQSSFGGNRLDSSGSGLMVYQALRGKGSGANGTGNVAVRPWVLARNRSELTVCPCL